MSSPVKEALKEEIAFRAETMRRRLQSRCKGLLEVLGVEALGPYAKVQYLHRTVKEFLKSLIFGNICFLAKTVRPGFIDANAFFLALRTCIEYSLRLENRAREVHLSTPNELGRAVSGLVYTTGLSVAVLDTSRGVILSYGDNEHWKRAYDLVKEFRTMPFGKTYAFFIYAFQYPPYSYIEYKLGIGQSVETQIRGHSLLYEAVDAMDFKQIHLLLKNGASPNKPGADPSLTPWRYVLWKARGLEWGTKSGNSADIAEIINTFLENNPDTLIKIDKQTAEELIKSYLQSFNSDRVQELRSKFTALKKTQKATKRQSLRFRKFLKLFGDKD